MGSSISSQVASNLANRAYHHPSPTDVSEVRCFLIRFLPRELADDIIDFAEYWPRMSAMREVEIRASAHLGNHNIAQWCYLLSPAIVPDAHSDSELGFNDNQAIRQMKVKKLRFWMKSNDQGWGGEPEHRGSYRASWTWFEASILRPASSNPSADQRRLIKLLEDLPVDISHKVGEQEHDDIFRSSGFSEVEVDGSHRSIVQRNICVSKDIRDHEVVWTNDDPVGWLDERTVLDERGRGLGKGFVHSILPGDRVALLARAQYPGWTNEVHAARIDIFYAV